MKNSNFSFASALASFSDSYYAKELHNAIKEKSQLTLVIDSILASMAAKYQSHMRKISGIENYLKHMQRQFPPLLGYTPEDQFESYHAEEDDGVSGREILERLSRFVRSVCHPDRNDCPLARQLVIDVNKAMEEQDEVAIISAFLQSKEFADKHYLTVYKGLHKRYGLETAVPQIVPIVQQQIEELRKSTGYTIYLLMQEGNDNEAFNLFRSLIHQRICKLEQYVNSRRKYYDEIYEPFIANGDLD